MLEKLSEENKERIEKLYGKKITEEALRQITEFIIKTKIPKSEIEIVYGECVLIPTQYNDNMITYAVIPLSAPTIIIKKVYMPEGDSYAVIHIFIYNKNSDEIGWKTETTNIE